MSILKITTLYEYGEGFTNTTDSFHDSGGKTITGSDIKDLIENPADDKPTLKITRSTGKFEKILWVMYQTYKRSNKC
jgi:hypothetical protein